MDGMLRSGETSFRTSPYSESQKGQKDPGLTHSVGVENSAFPWTWKPIACETCAAQPHPETQNSIKDTPNGWPALLSSLANCSVQAISLDFQHPPNLGRNKSLFAARVKPSAF